MTLIVSVLIFLLVHCHSIIIDAKLHDIENWNVCRKWMETKLNYNEIRHNSQIDLINALAPYIIIIIMKMNQIRIEQIMRPLLDINYNHIAEKLNRIIICNLDSVLWVVCAYRFCWRLTERTWWQLIQNFRLNVTKSWKRFLPLLWKVIVETDW